MSNTPGTSGMDEEEPDLEGSPTVDQLQTEQRKRRFQTRDGGPVCTPPGKRAKASGFSGPLDSPGLAASPTIDEHIQKKIEAARLSASNSASSNCTPQKSFGEGKMYLCDKCDFKTTRLETIVYHQRSHSGFRNADYSPSPEHLDVVKRALYPVPKSELALNSTPPANETPTCSPKPSTSLSSDTPTGPGKHQLKSTSRISELSPGSEADTQSGPSPGKDRQIEPCLGKDPQSGPSPGKLAPDRTTSAPPSRCRRLAAQVANLKNQEAIFNMESPNKKQVKKTRKTPRKKNHGKVDKVECGTVAGEGSSTDVPDEFYCHNLGVLSQDNSLNDDVNKKSETFNKTDCDHTGDKISIDSQNNRKNHDTKDGILTETIRRDRSAESDGAQQNLDDNKNVLQDEKGEITLTPEDDSISSEHELGSISEPTDSCAQGNISTVSVTPSTVPLPLPDNIALASSKGHRSQRGRGRGQGHRGRGTTNRGRQGKKCINKGNNESERNGAPGKFKGRRPARGRGKGRGGKSRGDQRSSQMKVALPTLDSSDESFLSTTLVGDTATDDTSIDSPQCTSTLPMPNISVPDLNLALDDVDGSHGDLNLSSDSDGEDLPEGLTPSQQDAIKSGDILWLKYSGLPFWPAVVRRVYTKRGKIVKLSVYFITRDDSMRFKFSVSYNKKKIVLFGAAGCYDKHEQLMNDGKKSDRSQNFQESVDWATDFLIKRAEYQLSISSLEFFGYQEQEADKTPSDDASTDCDHRPVSMVTLTAANPESSPAPSADESNDPEMSNRHKAFAEKRRQNCAKLITVCRSEDMKNHLKAVQSGIHQSQLHDLYYKVNKTKDEQKSLEQICLFGPIADEDQQDEVLQIFTDIFTELFGEESYKNYRYLQQVLIPEGLIYAIQVSLRRTREQARALYERGVVYTREDREQQRLELLRDTLSPEQIAQQQRRLERAAEKLGCKLE